MDLSYYKQDSREMRKVYILTLGLFLLTVRAEIHFQGYPTEQTNDTTVTKDLLLEKENAIGHGTEAPPTENTYRHTAVAVTAKIPEVVRSDARPTPRLGRAQMTKVMTVIASSHEERFAFRNRQKPLTSQKGNSTATRIYTKSEMPLISNYEKIVLSSTQAAFESMMNNTSEPEVNLSTDAVKSSRWLHALHVNRSQGSSESIPLTSADRGLGLPVLSASHPHVIDNLAALLHDNADKQAQRKNEKEISTLKRNKSPSGTMRSIIQKPGLSATVSSNSPSEGLDFHEFTTSLLSLHAKSDREQENILNITKIKSALSDTGTVASDTRPLGETSSITQNDTEKQSRLTNPVETSATERPVSTNPALHRSSKMLFPVRKPVQNTEQEKFGKTESTVPPHVKPRPSLSTNFQNTFVLHQPLDVSSGSENNTPVITEAALSTQKSVFQEGSDHNAASHPSARMRLIEAHRTVVPFSFGKRTTSAVKNPESHSLTGGAASLISALRSQTPAKPSSQTKELTLTSLPKDSAIKFTSTTAKTRASATFTTLNSIVQQPSVYPSGPANKPVMKELQFPTFTTQKTDVSVTLLSESRQESDDVVSALTLTPVLSESSSGRLTMHRFSATQSKITPEKTLDVTTPPSFERRNTDLRGESHVVHNLKLRDKSEQVWNAAAEYQDIINTADRQGEEITDPIERQKSPNDKTERGSEGELIINGAEVNQKSGRRRQSVEEHETNTSRQNTGGIIEEDAERTDTTIINTGSITKDAAANPRECLTKEAAETRREGTARKKDLIHNREIGREDVTNVPPGATSDSEELNRDKGHTVINSSPCRSLIKRLEATEQKGIYLAENTARNVEMRNKAFSYEVTSTHKQLRSTRRSRTTSLPTETHTQMKPRPSLHGAMIAKPGDTASPAAASAQNKVTGDAFSVTAIQKTLPNHTSGVGALKLSDAWKPTVSPRGSSTKSAHLVLNAIRNIASLTTPRLAITAGFLKAQPHFTVNSSTLSLSIIYNISNHRHKFTTSGSELDSLPQTTNQPGHTFESRVKDSLTSNLIRDVNMSPSVKPAAPQQMCSDSSSRALTAETLPSEAHISTGRPQPHQGQSAGQISQSSSSSSFDMTSGQNCSFQLSAHAAHSHALPPPVDDNRQRSPQTLMATMSPKARNDQLSPSSMSILLNSMLLRADSLPGTYSLTAITRSGSEEETSEGEYANTGSGRAESLLEANHTEKNDSERTIASSAVKRSDAATQSTDEVISSSFMVQTVGGSGRDADDFSSPSMSHAEKRAAERVNENDRDNPFNIDRNKAANKAVKSTLNNNHLSQLEGYNETSTQPLMFKIQTAHEAEQAVREHFLPLFGLEPNGGAETAAFTEPDSLVPEMPQSDANYVMTDAYFSVESRAAEISGRQMLPGSASDNAVAVLQISSPSDLKVSNTSTQQPSDRALDATSGFQIITPRNNDFVSPAARINGPVSRESHELELTTSERTRVVTEKSFQVAHAERMLQINRHAEPRPLRDADAPPGTTATTHPVTVHRFKGGQAPNTGPRTGKYGGPAEGTPQAAAFAPVTSASAYGRATVGEATRTYARKMTTKTLRASDDRGHLERHVAHGRAHAAEMTTQPDVTATRAAANAAEWTPVAETNTKTQLTVGAAESDRAQTTTRSANAAAEGEMPVQESGRGLLLLEPGPVPELPGWKHRRRTPPHLYLSGVAEVSEDLCGSGNYTAEMSLNLGRDVEPGDAVPVLGNLRVVINLKTNNSLINLEVTSCCLSPTVQPDLTNSTCCLFSRLAAEPVGITPLPSALSTSASFTISLFQMINYSVVYLHCDLSVCLRNRSDCERECPEQRSAFPAEGPDAIVANLRNRVSFGPVLKEVKNSTFLEEIEPSELDLALVIVSLVVGSSLVTVMLLLVWLAYRRRAIWLLRSAAPPAACCGCMHPGGDLILP